MKRFYFLLLALCLFGLAHAQVGVMRSSGVFAVQKSKPQDLGPMTKNGNIYYYHGEPMKQAQMVQFLNENCKEAFDHYQKNLKLERAGWALFGVGFGAIVTGGVLNYFALARDKDLYEAGIDAKVVIPVSYTILGIGGAMFVSSIPLICVGAIQKKNIHRYYNTWCGYKELEQETSQLELRLQSGSNGLGLALSF